MKVGIVQYAPEVGQVEGNIDKVDTILKLTNLNDVDWIILPELALTGYNFETLKNIQPFLEPTAAGISTTWAKRTAKIYNCKVTIGYPEVADVEIDQAEDKTRPDTDHDNQVESSIEKAKTENYNSTVTVDRFGKVLTHYRKRYLYTADQPWASSGPKTFFSGNVDGVGKVCMGICMDLNSDPDIPIPDKYKLDSSDATEAADASEGKGTEQKEDTTDNDSGNSSPDSVKVSKPQPASVDHSNADDSDTPNTTDWLDSFLNCDFAQFINEQKPDLAVVNMAWLTTMSEDQFNLNPDDIDMATLKYWISRFRPLCQPADDTFTAKQNKESQGVYRVILANRAGIEGTSRYAGSSCVLEFGHDDIRLYGYLGRAETGCMIIDLESEPKYRIKEKS